MPNLGNVMLVTDAPRRATRYHREALHHGGASRHRTTRDVQDPVGRDATAMRRLLATVSLAAAMAACPAIAFARTADLAVRGGVDVAAGIVTLLAALWLLVVALRLAEVSAGSTYAENIRWVVLGSLCLAGSVLANWSIRFMPDAFSTAQAQLGANLFIVAAIVFLAIYFTRVLRALSRFMKGARALSESAAAAADDLADILPDEPAGQDRASAAAPEDDARGSDG
jgi:hypothetical protein